MPEQDLIPIQSLDIQANSTINFNLYVCLPLNKKYVLFRRRGGTLEAAKIEIFKQYNVRNFFIERDNYHDFVKYVALRIKTLVGSNDTLGNRRMMASAAKSILSSTLGDNNPAVTEALMGNLNDITKVIIESVLENTTSYNKKTFQRFAELAQKGSHFQRHPVNVASLSVLIAFGIGYSTGSILADLAMASLIHDVGLSKLPYPVILRSHQPNLLEREEREALYQHPQMTLDLLKARKVELSALAQMIILQHHEEFNGFGYPNGIRGHVLNEFAQILKVADEIDQLILDGFSTAGNLKLRVSELMDHLARDKVIEPGLAYRIKDVLV